MWGEREGEREMKTEFFLQTLLLLLLSRFSRVRLCATPNPAAPSISQAQNSKPLPPPIAELNSEEASHSFQTRVYAVSSV